MKRPGVILTATVAAAMCWCLTGAGSAVASTYHPAGAKTPASGTWRKAMPVPGLAALNVGGSALLISMSCAGVGTCSAGGYYRDASSAYQAFVVGESHGIWGKAKEVPGSAGLNAGGDAQVDVISCAKPGTCTAAGFYRDAVHATQGFVVGEKAGHWGNAKALPGLAALNADGLATVYALSCGAVGDCSLGGYYNDHAGHYQAYVASEKNGSWGKALEVPHSGALNAGGTAHLLTMSCAAAGDCSAGGFYTDHAGHGQAFVVGQKNGKWGKALEVPRSANLNAAGGAEISAVSCATPGNCSAGGYYEAHANRYQAFVVGQRKGSWGKAEEVPRSGVLNVGGSAAISNIACPAVGDCSAAGYYQSKTSPSEILVVSEHKGRWGNAVPLPGSRKLDVGGNSEVYAFACATVGNCSAGGFYKDGSGHIQAFVASQRKGIWGKARQVPGSGALNAGGQALIVALSCAAPGECSAGGNYADGSGHNQAFVINQR